MNVWEPDRYRELFSLAKRQLIADARAAGCGASEMCPPGFERVLIYRKGGVAVTIWAKGKATAHGVQPKRPSMAKVRELLDIPAHVPVHGGTRKGAGRKPGKGKPHRPKHNYVAHLEEKAAADKVLASLGINGVGALVRGIGAGSVVVLAKKDVKPGTEGQRDLVFDEVHCLAVGGSGRADDAWAEVYEHLEAIWGPWSSQVEMDEP